MSRFSTFCIICRAEIPANRQRISAITCGKECQKTLRRGRLSDWKQRKCTYCGNGLRRARAKREQCSQIGVEVG